MAREAQSIYPQIYIHTCTCSYQLHTLPHYYTYLTQKLNSLIPSNSSRICTIKNTQLHVHCTCITKCSEQLLCLVVHKHIFQGCKLIFHCSYVHVSHTYQTDNNAHTCMYTICSLMRHFTSNLCDQLLVDNRKLQTFIARFRVIN